MIDEKIKARFWSMVNVTGVNECWEWKKIGSFLANRGYGIVYFNPFRSQKAHRVSWFISNGEIPQGLHVLHRCDNRKCVNPTHLFLGTNIDNVKDRNQKGRTSHKSRNVGEKHGLSKLADIQVVEIRKRWKNGEKQSKMEKEFRLKRGSLFPVVHSLNYKHL